MTLHNGRSCVILTHDALTVVVIFVTLPFRHGYKIKIYLPTVAHTNRWNYCVLELDYTIVSLIKLYSVMNIQNVMNYMKNLSIQKTTL